MPRSRRYRRRRSNKKRISPAADEVALPEEKSYMPPVLNLKAEVPAGGYGPRQKTAFTAFHGPVHRQALLDENIEAQALRYNERWLHTSEVLRLQVLLGLEANGQTDANLVEALARFQEAHPHLPVDGRANALTLTQLFEER